VELDGSVHDTAERKKADHKRDKYLTGLGNTVLRFPNSELLNDPEAVLHSIQTSLSPSGRDGSEGKQDEILFIDARNLGHLINRRTLEFSEEDIQKIASTYHNWRNRSSSPLGRGGGEGPKYEDIPGFCNSASIDRVKELDYVLTPGRYVGLPEEEDDFDFKERFTSLKKEFEEQLKEEEKLNKAILENLKKVKL
jgi:type I restriction enzyme M protein